MFRKIALAAAVLAITAGVADAASHKRHHAHRGYYAYQHTQVYRPRYADPTYGPGTAQMRYYQSTGRCVMDEGYGRFTFCDGGF